MVTDPVCGMDVDPSRTNFKTEYEGKTYYFCSESCQSAFNKNPTRFSDAGNSGRSHAGHGGSMGGCGGCGMGMGGGRMSYFFLAMMMLILLLLFISK